MNWSHETLGVPIKTSINYKKAHWLACTEDTENLFASPDTTNITETTYRIITAQFNSLISKTGEKHIPRGDRKVHNPNFTPEIKSLIETRDNIKHSPPFPNTEVTARTVLSLNEQISTKIEQQQTQNFYSRDWRKSCWKASTAKYHTKADYSYQ